MKDMETTRTKVNGVEIFYFSDGTVESRITTLNDQIWFGGTAALAEGHDISATGKRTKLLDLLKNRHPKLFDAATANAVANEILSIMKPELLNQSVLQAKQIEDHTANITYTIP
jgi:hypothetical protein